MQEACQDIHPDIQDKLDRFKQYAEIMMPAQPWWVWTEDDTATHRCCTSLTTLNPEYSSGLKTLRWYEGEIDCSSTNLSPRGYGVYYEFEERPSNGYF